MDKLKYLALMLLCMACSTSPREITPAFYFWKQRYQGETTPLAKKLYVKMFDVTWDATKHTAHPVAILDQRAPFPDSMEIVPVVFLMNEIWQEKKEDTLLMAQRVCSLLEQLCKNTKVKEVQLDCDWTRNSKAAYFGFLRNVRQQAFMANKQLSVTIRMHQVKYTRTNGIPPADKGLLMCYNMGDLRKFGDHNSILNMEELKAYTEDDQIRHYPLSLDLALPLFEWSVLFRNKLYAGLLRNIGSTQLENTTLFEPQGKQLYTSLQDTTLNGYMIRRGDVIRFETCSPDLLKKAARYLSRQRQAYNPTVIFYHLDSLILRKYNHHELETIYNIFE
ncbi:hypothetical protein GFS24_19640 [Chitinophaga sp. SYP-B3965]|uniref:hypothetical protein n=1 Tax=Chitinophaga sp. SYP-B3965 TaxID=2663120 RepID=UPI001299E482|nr:hypothetical protein [Chitinophaga sp. SYP-B3965]MRG47342.1 hypothetical protein [Chitinophaga sp. SYP-B3965]